MITQVSDSGNVAPLHFITPVWGESYTRLFVDIALPTLLSGNNLPSIAGRPGSIYRIFTTEAGRALIEQSPAYRELAAMLPVQFHPIQNTPAADEPPYALQSDCYRQGIQLGEESDAALVFHNSDVIIADGGIKYLADQIDSGRRAVLAMGVRLDRDRTCKQLHSNFQKKGEVAITVSPRELARIGIDNLHPITKQHIFNRPGARTLIPYGLFWQVGDEGLLMRCFNLHPVVVRPRVKDAVFTTSIDVDYLENACPDPQDTDIVTDSDRFLAFELSDADRTMDAMPFTGEAVEVARWAHFHTTAHYRSLLRHKIILHAGATDGEQWSATEASSDSAVDFILKNVRDIEALGGLEVLSQYGTTRLEPLAVPLHFVTSVWGEEYAELFTSVMLPSILSARNLQAIPNRADAVYRIYTCKAGRKTIEASRSYRLLSNIMAVEILPVDESEPNRYIRSSNCYRDSIKRAAEADAASIFLIPDMILADGSIASICRILGEGARAIMITGFRVVREDVIQPLVSRFGDGEIITVPPRELVKMALEYPHPISLSHFYDGNTAHFHPAGLYWRVGDNGILMHCFHLHPVAVFPHRLDFEFFGTIDDDFLHKARISAAETHTVNDSDDILWCEMSPRDYSVPTLERLGIIATAEWVRSNANDQHRQQVHLPLRLHTKDIVSSEWVDIERRALRSVDDILAVLALRMKVQRLDRIISEFKYSVPTQAILRRIRLLPLRMVHITRAAAFNLALLSNARLAKAKSGADPAALVAHAYLAVYQSLRRFTGAPAARPD